MMKILSSSQVARIGHVRIFLIFNFYSNEFSILSFCTFAKKKWIEDNDMKICYQAK